MNTFALLGDVIRRLENIVRIGIIHEINHDKARCTVQTGDIITTFLPWITLRAGTDQTWDAPTIGEQCLVLAPSGELATAVVIYGIYSTQNPPPSNKPNIKTRHFEDGAVITYDTQAHSLTAILPSGGTATITATGGITINGNTTINGDLSVSDNISATGTMKSKGSISSRGDVIAGNISLKAHKHQEQGDNRPTGGALP